MDIPPIAIGGTLLYPSIPLCYRALYRCRASECAEYFSFGQSSGRHTFRGSAHYRALTGNSHPCYTNFSDPRPAVRGRTRLARTSNG
jgi:hypothetical protein